MDEHVPSVSDKNPDCIRLPFQEILLFSPVQMSDFSANPLPEDRDSLTNLLP